VVSTCACSVAYRGAERARSTGSDSANARSRSAVSAKRLTPLRSGGQTYTEASPGLVTSSTSPRLHDRVEEPSRKGIVFT
jgi:hypothetical protein